MRMVKLASSSSSELICKVMAVTSGCKTVLSTMSGKRGNRKESSCPLSVICTWKDTIGLPPATCGVYPGFAIPADNIPESCKGCNLEAVVTMFALRYNRFLRMMLSSMPRAAEADLLKYCSSTQDIHRMSCRLEKQFLTHCRQTVAYLYSLHVCYAHINHVCMHPCIC